MIRCMERLFSHRTGKKIEEPNISAWRRTVCGDLTSAFVPWDGQKFPLPKAVQQPAFYEQIHAAKFQKEPGNFHALSPAETMAIRERKGAAGMPTQEKGTR